MNLSKIRLTAVVMLGMLVLMHPGISAAHQKVKDNTGQINALVHFEPAEDPTFGISNTIHFYLENDFDFTDVTTSLYMTSPNGLQESVQASAEERTVTAKYIFKKAGKYNFKLVLTPNQDKSKEHVITFSETVEAPAKSSLLVIIGFNLLAILGIIATSIYFKKRH